MPGMTERHASHGPKLTYFPWTAVIGGRVCEPDPSHDGYIQHASDASVTVVGMAMQDAAKRGEFDMSAYQLQGLVVNAFTPREVVCQTQGVFFDIDCTTALNRGQKVVAAADGKVRAFVAGTDNPAAVLGKNVGPKLTAAGKARIEWKH